MINEVKTTRNILKHSFDDLIKYTEVDVVIAGAGPSGMIASKYLADNKVKTLLIEKKLSIGGGIWGGGMMFPYILVQKDRRIYEILKDFGIKYRSEKDGLVISSIETASKLCAGAVNAGAKIFNGIAVEDVMIRKNRICGVVINWAAVEVAGLHVDPLTLSSKFVVDATGHPSEVSNVVVRKVGRLKTPSGKIEGEKSMWLEKSENLVVKNTKEAFPGLYVCGMAANAVFGAPRMGPIFGGMFLSGKKVADKILNKM
ncbi:MAG: thiazole biosynthesis protein [Endomicrobiales bacterium]|nr:thiazole biosynthesis protein [Endomicrobiales bacterium]